ncbi:hypothetical protein [Streptomyces sparsus]
MTWPIMIGAADMAGADRAARVVDALAGMFGDLAAGRTHSPPRTVVQHGPQRELLAGAAVWEPRGFGSVKVTTLTPGNPGRGLPLIHGVVVLTDLETGRVTALLDGAELTAVRTGAVAALATRLCAAEDAADLAVQHPVHGAGPGRFGDLSPAAAAAPQGEARPHSALLQMAAEQGTPGLLLLAASFGWLLLALGRSPAATPLVLTAAAALTAIAILACVSNALSFSPVATGVGVLAGLATAARPEH